MDKVIKIGGSIPCEGCCSNVVNGTVYKIGTNSFICERCYDKAKEMYATSNDGLEQFEEIEE
jgi:hypothetical protein